MNSDGIPDVWEANNGVNPFDPNAASEISTNPFAHGLNNMQVYENPSVLLSNNYDSVGDGIPDWWRVLYFNTSTTTNSSSCASCDPDSDTFSNLQEYRSGMNPLAPNGEWNGPFTSWDNIQTKYGATGNGMTDDTAALSNALVNAGVGTNSPVVYFPNGTYNITAPITLSSRSGLRFVGQDPARTIIKAAGGLITDSNGDAIITFDQVTRSSIERITFDGSGNPFLTLMEQASVTNIIFDTADQYLDCVFTNGGVGLYTGAAGYGGSEVSVLRCKFYDCAQAGLNTGNLNALDNWVQDSEIGHCQIGLTDHYNNGGGGFHAYQCFFHDNSNDVVIGNTTFFGFRDNLSTNSGQFMFCYASGTAAQITLQRNTIINNTLAPLPAINVGNEGQAAFIDNAFLTPIDNTGTVVFEEADRCQAFAISNLYSSGSSDAETLTCTPGAISLDKQVISRPSNSGTLVVSGTLTNVGRFITNLWASATATDIQNAIYSVTNRAGQHPVVHIP